MSYFAERALLPLDSVAPPEAGEGPKLRRRRLRLDVIEVTGGLPLELVERIVRQRAARFHSCRDKAAERNSPPSGTLVVRIAIDADGRVADARSEASTVADAGVIECFIRAFRTLSFPRPSGGAAGALVELLLPRLPD